MTWSKCVVNLNFFRVQSEHFDRRDQELNNVIVQPSLRDEEGSSLPNESEMRKETVLVRRAGVQLLLAVPASVG